MFAEFPIILWELCFLFGPCRRVVRKAIGATWMVVSGLLRVEFYTGDCEIKSYFQECGCEKKALCDIRSVVQ
jgi:hypothetical protein